MKESCEEGEYRQTRFYLDSLDNLLKIAKSTMENPALMRKEVANGLIKVQVVLFGIYTKVYVALQAIQISTMFAHHNAIQEQLEVRSSTLFSEELCCVEEVDTIKQIFM